MLSSLKKGNESLGDTCTSMLAVSASKAVDKMFGLFWKFHTTYVKLNILKQA